MNKGMMLALVLITSTIGPASAQEAQRGGIRTETQDRLLNRNASYDILWNFIGLLGLLGLLGLRGEHEEDSYHPAPFE